MNEFIPNVDTVNFAEESIDKALVESFLADTDKLEAHFAQVLHRLVTCLAFKDSLNREAFYLGHSGGKDSCLTHFILKKIVEGDVPIIHTTKPTWVKNYTHHLTKEFLYNLSYETPIKFLSESAFVKYLENKGGRLLQIDGTRADEGERSNGRSTDLVIEGQEIDRKHMTLVNSSGLFGIPFVYPIFDVTTPEVWAMLIYYGVSVSTEYKI